MDNKTEYSCLTNKEQYHKLIRDLKYGKKPDNGHKIRDLIAAGLVMLAILLTAIAPFLITIAPSLITIAPFLIVIITLLILAISLLW